MSNFRITVPLSRGQAETFTPSGSSHRTTEWNQSAVKGTLGNVVHHVFKKGVMYTASQSLLTSRSHVTAGRRYSLGDVGGRESEASPAVTFDPLPPDTSGLLAAALRMLLLMVCSTPGEAAAALERDSASSSICPTSEGMTSERL